MTKHRPGRHPAAVLLLVALLTACGSEAQIPQIDEKGTAIVRAEPAEPGPAATPPNEVDWGGFGRGSASYVRRAGNWAPALFLCDGTDQPVVLALTMPDDAGGATLVGFAKNGKAVTDRRVTIGAPDPGAGQIHYPLSEGGREIGNVHAINGDVLDGATTPTVSSVTIDGNVVRCRLQPETRLAGITARRSVLVTGPAEGPLAYRSFDFAQLADQTPVDQGRTSRATTTVTRGEPTNGGFRFRTGVTDYVVRVGSEGSGPGARIEVSRDGRPVEGEPMIAYTLAGVGTVLPHQVSRSLTCQPGPNVAALFDNERDVVELSFPDGRKAVLAGQRPASGIWYRGKGYELSGKGRDATLTGPNGVQRCRDDG